MLIGFEWDEYLAGVPRVFSMLPFVFTSMRMTYACQTLAGLSMHLHIVTSCEIFVARRGLGQSGKALGRHFEK